MEGRWGPYVTDGQTNASLPRGASPDELTFDQAVELLRVRAEAGPSRKPRRQAARKSAPSTAKKTAKAAKTPRKKTAKKKAAPRKKKGSSD